MHQRETEMNGNAVVPKKTKNAEAKERLLGKVLQRIEKRRNGQAKTGAEKKGKNPSVPALPSM
jgi:hypothetical protein